MRYDTMIKYARQGTVEFAGFAGTFAGSLGTPNSENPFSQETEPFLAAHWEDGCRDGWGVFTPPEPKPPRFLVVDHYEKQLFRPHTVPGTTKAVIEEYRARYIYFVRCTLSGLFKVGVSGDPRKRLKGLAASSGAKIECVALYRIARGEKTRLLERGVHEALKEHWSHGEWFRVDLSDLQKVILVEAERRKFNIEVLPPIEIPALQWLHRKKHGGRKKRAA